MAFEGLTRGLMNPSYTGMLGQSIAGGMQGIAQAQLANRQRQGYESVMGMLQQDDVTDPKVVQRIQAVQSQMGLDPMKVQELVMQQQAAARQKEQLKASIENQKIQQENLKLRKAEMDRAQKAQEIEQKVWASGADYKKLKEMYPQYAGYIEKQALIRQEAEMKRQEWSDAEAMKKPLGEEYLDSVAAQGDAYALAVENYRRDSKSTLGPVTARKRFEQQMANIDRQEASKEFLREQTRGYANSWAADFIESQDWGGFWGFGRAIPEEAEAALVPQVAQYYLENREAPSKDQMVQWATEWQNATAAENYSVKSSPGDPWHGLSVEDLILSELEGSKVSWGGGRSKRYKYTITRQEALERLKERGVIQPNG